MSKQCVHCGSYNTEAATMNRIKNGFYQTGRVVATIGTYIVCSIIRKHPIYSKMVWDNMNREYKAHHCCECGKDF